MSNLPEGKQPVYTWAGFVSGINSRADKTWKITIDSNELSPEDVSQLASMHQAFGYFAFKAEHFKQNEIENLTSIQSDFVSNKTPSQRMRDVLFILWKQSPEGYKDFHLYYEAKMEKFLTHLKSLILQ